MLQKLLFEIFLGITAMHASFLDTQVDMKTFKFVHEPKKEKYIML